MRSGAGGRLTRFEVGVGSHFRHRGQGAYTLDEPLEQSSSVHLQMLSPFTNLPTPPVGVPPLVVVGGDGNQRLLEELPSLGFRYIYFHRDDCTSCQVLESAWASLRGVDRRVIAFVAYQSGQDLVADSARAFSFAARLATFPRTYPPMRVIPALFMVREDGLVMARAEGYSEVTRLMLLNHLVDPDSIRTLRDTLQTPNDAVVK